MSFKQKFDDFFGSENSKESDVKIMNCESKVSFFLSMYLHKGALREHKKGRLEKPCPATL